MSHKSQKDKTYQPKDSYPDTDCFGNTLTRFQEMTSYLPSAFEARSRTPSCSQK